MCISKYSLVFLLILSIASCTSNSSTSNSELSSNESTLKGKFIRVKDNKRAGIEGILDLISEIEFRNEHCHFTYVGTKMSGKYSMDEGFVYIYTGSDLGTLSMEIVSKDQLEGEGYIHGTFKREGTFVPEEKDQNTKTNYPEVNKRNLSNNPFEGIEKEDVESNETSDKNDKQPYKSSSTQADNPFGTGGNSSGAGSSFGNDNGTAGIGPGVSGGRVRLNDPTLEHIESDRDITFYLKLTIDEEGSVVSALSTSKATTTDQRIINQVLSAVKSQLKYNKSPGADLSIQYLTIKINAR
jgi:hypothetical protein